MLWRGEYLDTRVSNVSTNGGDEGAVTPRNFNGEADVLFHSTGKI